MCGSHSPVFGRDNIHKGLTSHKEQIKIGLDFADQLLLVNQQVKNYKLIELMSN
jgi:hypothetical protein